MRSCCPPCCCRFGPCRTHFHLPTKIRGDENDLSTAEAKRQQGRIRAKLKGQAGPDSNANETCGKNNNMKKLLITAAIVALLDQATKLAVEKLGIWHTLNSGIVFGTIGNVNTAAAILSALVLALAIQYYRKLPNKWLPKTSTALIAGGLAGNLIDRIMLGGVVDFIRIYKFPVFNAADMAVTAGVIGLIAYFAKENKR